MHPALAARRRRIQTIRRSVAGTAVAVFVALFSTIYIQMASGDDPALASSTKATSTAVASTPTPTSTSVADDGGGQSAAPAAVTTQQS
jgi:hypothetical protein